MALGYFHISPAAGTLKSSRAALTFHARGAQRDPRPICLHFSTLGLEKLMLRPLRIDAQTLGTPYPRQGPSQGQGGGEDGRNPGADNLGSSTSGGLP